ncbi:NAD(P)-binding domain-containing protein [Pseudonocardia xinjiangensis]|uniref:NAD(P)-binding domain-containing protein n=1 Tax=Pseudonocardia xinjiangensis TaxID=75289 RepID=UPI003D8D4469
MLIGFAGLGRMGRPMARNLARAGHEVLAYDPVLAATADDQGLAPDGVRLVRSVADLAAAPMTISMLPDGATTRELVTGRDGLCAAGVQDGHLHVIMGTVGPTLVREVAAAAAERGVQVVDAPVSGSVSLADAAQITTMVGGTEEQFARVGPVLAAMTKMQYHTGPVGSGSTAKLAVNAVLAALNQGVAEGMLLAEAGGLDTTVFYEVLSTSAAGAPYVGYKSDAFLSPAETAVSAPVSLIHKDVSLALDLAAEQRLTLPGAEAVVGVLDQATAAGLGEEDMAQVLAALRLLNASARPSNPEGTNAMNDDVEQIRELEDRRYDAIVAGDFDGFAKLAHPDLAYTHSTGDTDTLESYLEKCRAGFYDYHRIDHPVDRITVVGDTAIVVGEMNADLTAGGVQKTLTNRCLAVWVRSGGDWKLLGYQPTVIPGR